MADVFISYARQDRGLAEDLAKFLRAKGISVWWDAELVGSDDFQEVILTALKRAKAAIVLWTKNSVKSLFVRDEARFAHHFGKLVAVKASDVQILDIPFGFQSQHTDEFDNRHNILKAINKLGVIPSISDAAAKPTLDANQNRYLRDADQAAATRSSSSLSPSDDDEVRDIVKTSSFSAFLSGLTFRMPSFQLSSQGLWASIGVSVGMSAILIAAGAVGWLLLVWSAVALEHRGWTTHQVSLLIFFLISLLFAALTRISTTRLKRYFEDKNFAAGMIMAIGLLLGVTATVVSLSYLVMEVGGIGQSIGPYLLNRDGSPSALQYSMAISLSVAYVLWRIRLAR